jgi:hypothetical protein
MEREAPLTVYQPYWMVPMSRPYFVVRTRDLPQGVTADIRTAFHAIDPEVPVGLPTTMQEIVSDSVGGRRFQMSLVVAFAVFALVLASLGIYCCAKDVRARDTSCTRRARPFSGQDGHTTGHEARVRRDRRWVDLRVDSGPAGGRTALRRDSERPVDHVLRRHSPPRRRPVRLLASGTQGDAHQSVKRPSLRIGASTAPLLPDETPRVCAGGGALKVQSAPFRIDIRPEYP